MIIKVLAWDPGVRGCYRDSSNLSEMYFSTYGKANRYVESRRMKVRKMTEINLPRNDPRIDLYDKILRCTD